VPCSTCVLQEEVAPEVVTQREVKYAEHNHIIYAIYNMTPDLL